MKPSFDQLPPQKQHEIRQIVEVIKQVVDPEMVILFGSHAKGSHVDHRYVSDGILYEYISDYDLLVVTRNNAEKAITQEMQILQKTDDIEPALNLEIHEIDYINKGLEWGEYFWVDIVKEGIVMYDKGSVTFAEPRELTAVEKREKAQRYYDTWFPQGASFLRGANFFLGDNSLNLADFSLHQAAESLYYAVLLVFTDYKPKIHNLWKLRKKVKPFSEDLFFLFRAETDKNEKRLFELLKQGYIEARYDSNFTISEVDLKSLIERITKMIPIVEKICIEKINGIS